MLRVVNPATEQLLLELETDSPASVHEKFLVARAGQRAWAGRPLDDRRAAVMRFMEAMEAEAETLAGTLTDEMGKPLAQARSEIAATGDRIRFFVDHAPQAAAEQEVWKTADVREVITHEPLGVVANVSAWNYPYFVGTNVFIPALLMGNAVLYKPSEFATLTGLRIAELMTAAGVPEDAFIPVIGDGAVGAELVKQPLDGVFFTGSYPTGLKIARAAAEHLMKVQLELGGKDPAYVTDDVDPAAAAAALADGAFYNTGQSCCSVERIYVHARVYDAFLDAFLSAVAGFTVGDPRAEGTYIGPLTRPQQCDVLERQVEDAVGRGATLRCGGRRVNGPGHFFEPTVLTEVQRDMRVMREESFGPIIGIQRVGDDAEAIELMNDTEFGLTAGVYCRDEARARRLLARADAGTVYWNCCDRVSPRLPWSGRRHSGIGSTLSVEGIRTFLRPKAWHLRH